MSISEYFLACKEILLEPAHSMRRRLPTTSVVAALAFGLTSIWITAILTFLWDSIHEIFFLSFLQRWLQEQFFQADFTQFLQSAMESLPSQASLVLLRPYTALLGILFSALILFIFARFLLEEENGPKIQYSDQIKVLAFASTASWLALIPFFGGILAYVGILLLTVIGIREAYSVSTKRAALVVFLPQALAALMFFLLVALLVILIFTLSLQEVLDQPQLFSAWGADEPEAILAWLLRLAV